jgi:TDG/mug DNA glycosylase family protein
VTCLDDNRLPEWGLGITNLIARPSPGIDTLAPAEYVDGWRVLDRKIKRYRPQVVAFVGVTLFRALRPMLADSPPVKRPGARPNAVTLGPQAQTIHGARVFVLPNPSGRNANFTYAEMLSAFRGLADYRSRLRTKRGTKRGRL